MQIVVVMVRKFSLDLGVCLYIIYLYTQIYSRNNIEYVLTKKRKIIFVCFSKMCRKCLNIEQKYLSTNIVHLNSFRLSNESTFKQLPHKNVEHFRELQSSRNCYFFKQLLDILLGKSSSIQKKKRQHRIIFKIFCNFFSETVANHISK